MSSGNLFEDSRLKGEESHDEPNEEKPIEGDSNTLGGTKHTRRKEIADVKLKLTLLQYYPLETLAEGVPRESGDKNSTILPPLETALLLVATWCSRCSDR